MQGRRRPDMLWGELPESIEPGDYWKITNYDLGDAFPDNLTRTVWQFFCPDGNGVGTLVQHTVRENEDGTITVAPGDGSSNSILHQGGNPNRSWHGYVDHGVWREC